jgi:outer membrane protein, heavy metal efflux system
VQIEHERLATEIENFEDSRQPLLAAFKAALGLKADGGMPAIPAKFESTPLAFLEDLFATALTGNPRPRVMEAEIRRAEASLRLAYRARVPDFSLGIEADVKSSPGMHPRRIPLDGAPEGVITLRSTFPSLR